MVYQSRETIDIRHFGEEYSEDLQQKAIRALESGQVVYFPSLAFPLKAEELALLDPSIVDPKSKNISYTLQQDRLAGYSCDEAKSSLLKGLVRRYALESQAFLNHLFPHYRTQIIQAKTSLRPVEISGRKNPSYRKDDTRLHVDSFPSMPVKGRRILRFFTNINPNGKPRVWRVGEPFEDVVRKIAPRTSRPIPFLAEVMKRLKITKDLRTPYDHYMLQIHNAMKKDLEYQRQVPQEEVFFPPGSSWMCFTDQVSHAAMSGQHVLEQTFYLPFEGLKERSTSPLAALERYYKAAMI